VKPGLLCLLLLPACSFLDPDYSPEAYAYVLTWYCVSPEGCERTEEVARIDRATRTGYDFHLTSTQDPSFDEEGDLLFLDSLLPGCAWIYYLSFFGHDLERSMLCYGAGGFELELSIPNEDPAMLSQWVVSGRDVRFL
jgi:hypothetical protein